MFKRLYLHKLLLMYAHFYKEEKMNKDIFEGNWEEIKGKMKQKWGKLTDDDLDVIDGQREELVGKIQARYGISKEKAEQEADNFLSKY